MARERPTAETRELEAGRPGSVWELSSEAALDLWVGLRGYGQDIRGGFLGNRGI